MSTYVLWDIDGTLIYNTPQGGALYIEAIEQVTGTRPTVPVDNPHGMTEGQLLIEILKANELDTARIGDVLYQLDVLSREQHERGHVREACVGAYSAVAAVADRGWTNALLTGNGPNRARYKLLAAGFDPEDFDWEHSYFGHESPTRHHLTAGARASLVGQNAVIIGDTPNDGLAADSAGIPFIAVATGVYGTEELARTSARVVVDDLETGLAEVLAAIGDTEPEAESQADGESQAEADPAPEPEPVEVAAQDAAEQDGSPQDASPQDGSPQDASESAADDLARFGENPDIESSQG